MKKRLLVAALSMLAAQAHASKAREAALQNAMSINDDVQDVFDKPGRVHSVGNLATFEFGTSELVYGGTSGGTVSNSTPNAEGGVIKSWGDSKLGVYVGHQSESFTKISQCGSSSTNLIGSCFTANEMTALDNPLSLVYGMKSGDLAWGAHLLYASSSKKSGANPFTKSATGVSFSIGDGVWEGFAIMGLGASIKDDSTGGARSGDQNKADSSFKLGGQYWFDSMLVYGYYTSFGGTYTTAAGTTTSKTAFSEYKLGFESRMKGENSHFFYGLSYVAGSMAQNGGSSAGAYNGVKVETTSLPLILGVEADATSWMVLRASVSQPVLTASTKVTTSAASTTDTMTDSATVALGSGFKFNKLLLDVVLTAGTTGALNANAFGTNAGLTYNF